MSETTATTRTAARGASASPASQTPVGVGVLGATGYSGLELIRLLAAHPALELRAAASRQHAGAKLASVWPSLADRGLVLDEDPEDPGLWIDRGVEVVFAALPHGAFASRARAFLAAGLRVIDLSADFRLREPAEYARRYKLEHPEPKLLGEAIYGLTEWCGPGLAASSLVANPGCYATAVLLATLPAVQAGFWSGAPIVANALSGISGAGRAPSLATSFVECGTSAGPYKVGEEHAHLGEMCQAIDLCQSDSTATKRQPAGGGAGDSLPLLFNPHLVPMARGIVASVAIPLERRIERADAEALYAARYAGRPFIRLLEGDSLPETRHVRGSNRCDLAVRVAAGGRMLLAYAALDNLVKGAAGQAIQNCNVQMGWPESTGLPQEGWAVA